MSAPETDSPPPRGRFATAALPLVLGSAGPAVIEAGPEMPGGRAVVSSGNIEDFFKLGYRRARYSFGCPACPDLADRAMVARLLRPERTGVDLSGEMQLRPEQSTGALIVHHPEAEYFST